MEQNNNRLVDVQLEEYIITVDEETANNLKDPLYAAEHLKLVRADVHKKEESKIQCTLWKSAKCPTPEDHESTLALLSLRNTYNEKFVDKKTHKNELWMQIATAMNKMGYFVGAGIEGREKVRQKFSNMQTTYIKYCDNRNKSGEGKHKVPKYFNELDDILGDKHKTAPVLVIDSLRNDTETSSSSFEGTATSNSLPNTSYFSSVKMSMRPTLERKLLSEEKENLNTDNKASNSSLDGIENSNSPSISRFSSVKRSVRPKPERNRLLEELVQIQKENQHARREEFQVLFNVMREESKERHNQMMALISNLGKLPPQKKKRRISDTADSD